MSSIAVVCTARPSYAKLKPVVRALVERKAPVVLYMVGGSMLFRFGAVVDQAERDFPGLPIIPIYSEFDGFNGVTAAKSTGALLMSLADTFSITRPGVVVVNHDRREVLAVAQAAAYQNIPVAHIGGGERSGNIDDRVRDAVTCLATYHAVATERAADRIEWLVGHTAHLAYTGCPSIDVAKAAKDAPPVTADELGGAGKPIDLEKRFVVVLQHSETENPAAAYAQMEMTLQALSRAALQGLVFWPGADAGADGTAKVIRQYQQRFHTVRTLPPERFLRLLTQSACLVGNSSAGIRECSYLGVPVVNIGDRQRHRERARNVVDVPWDVEKIDIEIRHQSSAVYPSSKLYGEGDAAEKIAEGLITCVR